MVAMPNRERNIVPVISALIAVLALFVAAAAVAASNKNATSASGAGSAGAAAPTVSVSLSEYKITPQDMTVPPGPIQFQVSNAGSMEHNFEIVGVGKTRLLKPGESTTLDVTLKAGHYTTQCDVAGHAGSGMTGMIMAVTGARVDQGAASADTSMTWQQMDAAMAAVANQFPAKTAGHGGDLLAPTILSDGTKEYDLNAKVVDWEVAPGKTVKAWTYNGVVPAPTIHVNVGDKVKVVLKNDLPESTSLHFHGIRVPNAMDGVDPYTQPPIEPGQSFTYAFTALEPSVGMYHSHHDAQVQVPNGMAGAFLIGEMPLPAGYGITTITKEISMVLNDAGTIGLAINGKSFPATEPYTLNVGQTMMVHYFNEGLQTHPMHLHQPHGLVIALDGAPLQAPYYADTIPVAPGQRITVLYTAQDPGVWAWHCHILTHAETASGMTGMVTALIVK
jgi:FtsP/CotA-like multicopper oxidase with cupredoxin domain